MCRLICACIVCTWQKHLFSWCGSIAFICSIWTASSEFGTYSLCEQLRFRRACASPQSRQNLHCSLIQAVSQEEPSDRKPDLWPLWMAGHAQLKFVMTECSKTQIRLAGPILHSFFSICSAFIILLYTLQAFSFLWIFFLFCFLNSRLDCFQVSGFSIFSKTQNSDLHCQYGHLISFFPFLCYQIKWQFSSLMTKPTTWPLNPAKTRIRLGICPV